jgi:hypothetical protein
LTFLRYACPRPSTVTAAGRCSFPGVP